eukprot:TRINITY_DN3045_c0_g2_i1.p3 TRINITY_DN3045_c0_g2~~TRINITY_DN3045_c0_g2_i1.p3  ORF type:complete len:176 (-),score=39.86 TRINITY_DN3045_c0_g2_i1:123-650(-)
MSSVSLKVDELKDKLREKTGECPSFAEGMSMDFLSTLTPKKAEITQSNANDSVSPVQSEGDIRDPPMLNKESTNKNASTKPSIPPSAQSDKPVPRKRVNHHKKETMGTLKTTDRVKEMENGNEVGRAEQNSQQCNVSSEKEDAPDEDNVDDINRKYEQLLKRNVSFNLIVAGYEC